MDGEPFAAVLLLTQFLLDFVRYGHESAVFSGDMPPSNSVFDPLPSEVTNMWALSRDGSSGPC